MCHEGGNHVRKFRSTDATNSAADRRTPGRSTASALVCGHHMEHAALERELSERLGAKVAVHLERPLLIDYDAKGRRVNHTLGGTHASDLD